jgi:DNA polymerase-3 subunit alpha
MKNHSNFVHLHTHTEYSFLDGAIRIDALVARAVEYGLPALAITDHGGMFGAIEFHAACMAAGIKPIIGFEAYVAPRSRHEKTKGADEHSADHLILLARDNTGYHNLMKLSTIGYTEGFYYKPRIDLEALRELHEGLIATTACIAGAVPRALIAGDRQRAKTLAAELSAIFGEGNLYFELQDHGIPEEKTANEGLVELGREMGIPLVAAQDAHYLNREEAVSHEILLCLQTHTTMSDPKRYRFSTDQVYFRSPKEMAALFSSHPEALANTVTIAERCNVEVKSKPLLPRVAVPEGFADQQEYLRHLAGQGLRRKYSHVTPGLEERLQFELDTICTMGFAGYFLIVRDFVQAAHDQNVMVGCRGSAAGSIVAYALNITNVDPIKFDLLFERFLNPERVSLPDADIDFADKERHKIIDYVIRKYGRDAVCQIINFGRMKAKMVVKDVARAMGLAIADANRLSGMVSEKTLQDSIAASGELSRTIKENPQYQELFRHARVLEGLARQAGMHAGGVIIAPGPVVNWSPLFKQQGAEEVMTQYDMNYVEKVGLVKMDFLGLSTLSVQQEAVRLITARHNVAIDVWKLPDGDEQTYALFGHGETTGIFQFESNGMQDYLRKLKPTNIEDLIAMNALYRPGPMEQIDVYIRRKHGEEKVEYLHPLLKDVLDVTYGVIIYQEQVMRVVQVMAGFTLGQADMLRRAMSKKKAEEMERAGKEFVTGALGKGVDRKIAEDVYNLIARFAQYGFNKSHATVYAHVAYQSGYLKAHYPLEYMAACLTTYVEDPDYFLTIKTEAERMGLKLLPPDVNTSVLESSIEGSHIRLGLYAVRNVGKAAEAVVTARGGGAVARPFATVFDLATHVDLRLVNKKCLESLVCAGALDGLPGTRAQLFAAIDAALDYGGSTQRERASGQTSLFGQEGGGPASGPALPEPLLPAVQPWTYSEVLAKEKEALGFYVSGHPLDRFRDEIRGFASLSLGADSLQNVKPGQRVTVGGTISSLRTHIQKNGKQMAFGELEDFEGAVELIIFSDAYEKIGHLLAPDVMVLVHGTANRRDGETVAKIQVDNAILLSDARQQLARSVHIRLRTQGLEQEFLSDVKQACAASAGECNLIIHLVTAENNDFRVRARQVKVSAEREAVERLRGKLGEENVWLGKTAA